MAAIVESLRDDAPALMGLALDVGLAGFTLSFERVEFLLQALVGRFAGVDRAANDLLGRHRPEPAALLAPRTFRLSSRPKKRGPDHRAPVIAWATADSEG